MSQDNQHNTFVTSLQNQYIEYCNDIRLLYQDNRQLMTYIQENNRNLTTMYNTNTSNINLLYSNLDYIRLSMYNLHNSLPLTYTNTSVNRVTPTPTPRPTYTPTPTYTPRDTPIPTETPTNTSGNSRTNRRQRYPRNNSYSTTFDFYYLISNTENNIPNNLVDEVVRPSPLQIHNAITNRDYHTISNPLNESCPISLDSFQQNDRVSQINNCGHIFNSNELYRWFETNVHCPICRYDIRDNQHTNPLPNTTSLPNTNRNINGRNLDDRTLNELFNYFTEGIYDGSNNIP
jgi:Ring finger domain